MKSYAIAVAAALASVATSGWAQSSVTIFGFLEQQVGRQTQAAPGTKVFDMGGSRLGFKGEEDLGGGLKANFYLESRGLDRSTAEQLIVEGFFQSVLNKIEMPAVQETVWDVISENAASE